MDTRQQRFDDIRLRLRRDWRNDNAVLEQYFAACVENWKIYKGPRTPKQVARLNAIYKQATIGDSPWVQTPASTKKEIEAEAEWFRLKGMPLDMAKRRYITFLAEIYPLLIDVMPSEKPPMGFPSDRKGRQICAKCNTVVGCQRPVLDMHKTQLRMLLLENEKLHSAEKCKEFIDQAMEGHQCMWGVHTYIHRADAKPFMEWFNLPENQGFQPYDYTPLFSIVRELVVYHYEIAWDMQQHKAEYSVDDMNAQLIRTSELKTYYEQLAGEEFFFHIPCTRDNDICNSRRQGDKGVNHTHPAELDQPSFQKPSFADLIQLRQQCVELGIKPMIGIETDIAKRCKIYQERILEHFGRLKAAEVAKKKNDMRAANHKKEKEIIQSLSTEMSKLQAWDAANNQSLKQIDNLLKKGCDLNTESPRGLTPLITMVLCGADGDMFVRAIRHGMETEFVNKYGYTALMVACRLRDAAIIHVLMKNGASALTCDPERKRTALHLCAYLALESEAQILYDYVKEGAGDSLKVISFLNAKDKEGDTALMIAARKRNSLMCKFLLSLGADPGARNYSGRTAATVAREAGWVDIAEWLGTKVGGGIKKVETISDQSLERRVRFGMMSLRDKIRDFIQAYISMLYGSHFAQHVNSCPLGSPALVAELKQDKISLSDEFQLISNAQYKKVYVPIVEQRYAMLKAKGEDTDNPSIAAKSGKVSTERTVSMLNQIDWSPEVLQLREMCREMFAVINKGDAAPDTECSKPKPWTALMCAAVINDTHTMKRLLREGSDINYGNKVGTTALMLAAQLNVVDSVAFLLQNGADINQVDAYGYSALAYATSLPLPGELQVSLCNLVIDGDETIGTRLTAERLLKLAKVYGPHGLGSIIDENINETGPEERAEWSRYNSLLESHGLSRIETDWQLQNSIKHAGSRLGAAADEEFSYTPQGAEDEDSETESEIAEREAYLALIEKKRNAKEAREQLESLRCPICTLLTPCSHFLRPETLKKLIDGGYKPPPQVTITRDGSALTKKQIEFLTERVLRESGLHDRKSDRVVDKLREYQKRIVHLEREKQTLLLEGSAHDEHDKLKNLRSIEETGVSLERQLVIANTVADAQAVVAKEWKQEIDEYGRIIFVNKVTSETWSMHITVTDHEARAYYFNPLTQQTQWDPPGTLAQLSLEVLSQAFPTAPEYTSVSNSAPGDTMLTITASPASDCGIPVKKKKKGGVKFAAEDEISQFENSRIGNEAPEPNDENISKQSESDISGVMVDLPLGTTPNNESTEKTTPLKSLLVTDEKKKTKKRVGGVRFVMEENVPDSVKVEIRTLPNEPHESELPEVSETTVNNSVVAQSDNEKLNLTTQEVQDEKSSTQEKIGAIVSNDDCKLLISAENTDMSYSSVASIDFDKSEVSNNSPEVLALAKLLEPPVQPLPPAGRKIFSFTKSTSLGASFVDGLLPSESTDRNFKAPRTPLLMSNQNQQTNNDALGAVLPTSEVQYPVFISGWVFSGIAVPKTHPYVYSYDHRDDEDDLFSLTSFNEETKRIAADMQVAPVEGVNVSLESWGVLLEHVRGILINQFLPLLNFACVASPKNWKVDAPRCPLCRLGIIRYKPHSQDFAESQALVTLLSSYCLSCAIRCVMYNKLKKCVPRPQKNRLAKEWPVYVPPELFPLERQPRTPIVKALSQSNLQILSSTGNEQKSPTSSPEKPGSPSSPKRPDFSPIGRSRVLTANRRPNSPTKPSTTKPNFIAKLLKRDEDSDNEEDHADIDKKMLNKTASISSYSSKTEKGVMMSKTAPPAFLRKFKAAAVNATTDKYDIYVEPEPVIEIDLEGRYGPQELALIPFLIAKGQYDEVERLLRVSMCLEDMLGEAGAVHTVHVLFLQADMYMLQNAFGLALGLYLDAVEILANALGFEDNRFIDGVYKVLSCSHKLGMPEVFAQEYISNLSSSLQSSMISSKQAMVDNLELTEIRIRKNRALLDEAFVQLKDCDCQMHSNSEFRQFVSSLKGHIAFINLLESPNGFAASGRLMFVQYCYKLPIVGQQPVMRLPECKHRAASRSYGTIAQFVLACCRLRDCENEEVYRFLLQNLIQKYLSKHENVITDVIPDCASDVSSIRNRVTEKLEKKGRAPTIDEFDVLFKRCVMVLTKLFPSFLRSSKIAKKMVIDDFLDSEAEWAFMSAVMIQSFWRRKYVSWQVSRKRANKKILDAVNKSG